MCEQIGRQDGKSIKHLVERQQRTIKYQEQQLIELRNLIKYGKFYNKSIEMLESVKFELLEFIKRFNGIIYGMIPEQVMAEQIEKCISEKIKMLGESK